MANSAPTTIFNFGPVLDQILTDVVILINDYATIINKENASLNNEAQIISSLNNNMSLLTSLINQVTVLNNNVANAVGLMELVVQGLGNVATLTLQETELTLLNQIVQNTSFVAARNITLDLEHATHIPQLVPTAPGP